MYYHTILTKNMQEGLIYSIFCYFCWGLITNRIILSSFSCHFSVSLLYYLEAILKMLTGLWESLVSNAGHFWYGYRGIPTLF